MKFKLRLYKAILEQVLIFHNYSYKVASVLVKKVEPGGAHPKHRIMKYHDFFVNNVKENDVVADIGCGKGEVAFDVAKKAKRVVGIDINESWIETAKKKHSAENIEYKLGDATKDFPNEQFDVVILSNVIEHIEERVKFLQDVKHLAPTFLIRVPMINRDWIVLYKKEIGVEWRLDNTHYTEYTLEQLVDEVERAGLHIESQSIQFGEIWAIVKK